MVSHQNFRVTRRIRICPQPGSTLFFARQIIAGKIKSVMALPSKKIFSYEEAIDLFPTVRDQTCAAVRRIETLMHGVQSREQLTDRKADIEIAVNNIIQSWVEEMTALGCEVKGLWLVDWDSGDGYYCWKYPEESVGYFHSYEDGFAGRVPVN